MAGQPRPHRPAVIARNARRTWGELVANVERVAGFVASRCSAPGAHVGVLLHNGAWQPELYFGISRAGCVVVPLNWRLTDSELGAVVDDAEIALIITSDDLAERVDGTGADVVVIDADKWDDVLAAAPPPPDPHVQNEDDVTMISYTSGTTGAPKGVMHTHRSLTNSVIRLAGEMRLRPDSVVYVCLPMFFAGATSSMAAPCVRGCTMVISDFSVESFLGAVEEHGVDSTIMVPTMISQVIRHVDQHPSALKGMTNWCYAGDAMPVNPLNKGIERFGRVFSGYYGLLESGLAGSTFLSEDHVAVGGDERRLRSAGRPTLGIEMRVVDLDTGEDVARDGQSAGEIWIRSPTVMKGYWRRPDLTAERVQDGWLRTSDIATWDEDGFLYLVDRATDMIITGGINVFPRDVENVIRRHPDVDQVAVVGMPSDEWGQVVTACLTLTSARDGDALRDEILQLCSGALAGYKKPRRLVVRDDLPMTGSGKVNKATLRTLLADQLGAR